MIATIGRFMASAISLVRIPPAAPTSAPAMISTTLPITKPAIATAVPVKALSSEMTTGMSAPPIGMTMATPDSSAAATTPARRASPLRPADEEAAAADGHRRPGLR